MHHSISPVVIKEYNSTRPKHVTHRICQAPFLNMFLTPDGKVNPCCGNRTYLMGKYPEESLHDIWFGEKAQKFRNYLLNYDLSHGCDSCRQNIEMKNYGIVMAKSYDHITKPSIFNILKKHYNLLHYGKFYDEVSIKNAYPKRIDFNLANTCNLECIMCDGWSSSSILKKRYSLNDFPNPYHQEFVEEMKEFLPHLKTGFFIGGEPFLINVFFELWEALIKVNPSCTCVIQTNGTILNNRIKKILKKGKFCFNISIDSIQKNTFEVIRKNANFEKTMDNLNYFIKYAKRKRTFTNLTVCPIQQNSIEVPALVQFANERKIIIYFNTVYSPSTSSFLGLNNEKIDQLIDYYSSFNFSGRRYKQKVNKSSFNILISQLKNIYKDDDLREKYLQFEIEQERRFEIVRQIQNDEMSQ